MISFNLKMKKYSEREKAIYNIMVITFMAVLIIIIVSSIPNPLCTLCISLYILTFFLMIGILLTRKNFEIGINLYLSFYIMITILIDLADFFPNEINSFLYMLPISFSLFFLESPNKYVYSFMTLSFYIFRILLFPDIISRNKFILILLVIVATSSVFLINRWVIQLHKYKVGSLQKIHNASIKILGKVAELKDEGTAYHLNRVELMVEMLCLSLRKEKKYKNYINAKYIHDIKSAAYLHDIGKIGIPDKILGKRGSLSDKEFETIKSHTTIGFDILSDAKSEIEGESVYDLAMEIARHHHEKWDGSGYPHHLSGDDIPFSARLMAVIDVYDALVSRRPYKVPFPHSKAIEIIREESGTHFDPQIADHFVNISEEIHIKVSPLLK